MVLRAPLLETVLFACLSAVFGCDETRCEAGRPCECTQMTDCFLECPDPGCNLYVHHLVHGGGICQDGCTQLCHDVTECSLSCGTSCVSQTHHTTSSGTLCGALCDHECHDMDRCGVIAGADSHVNCHNATTCELELGPGSTAECHSVETCRVTCAGPCQVHHTAVTQGPEVTCPGDAPRAECSPTLVACGSC